MQITGIESIEQIHESTHTIVYKGVRKSDKKTVAIKILKSEFPSIKNIARFNEEYEITKQLNINGIRRATEKLRNEGKHVIILEFLEGITLKEKLALHEVELETFLVFAIEVSEILNELHNQNIIHKDINPKNIILTDNNEVRIIDFGLSVNFKQTGRRPESAESIEGTIAYMSPEQTGRMNRSIDFRTDLYSLGVTFYEILTGKLPFESEDAMSLIYAHMAKKPVPLSNINDEIPEVISNIILKLLEKNAENRYQSAYGLMLDLKRCLKTYQEKGKIDIFPIAIDDVVSQFHIPEKLYGRENEIGLLLSAFDRTSRGAKEFMLVKGFSGIGKTSLVHEVHKPMTESRGYFISGKFDQYNRDVPYSAIVHALKDFSTQILSESKEQIAHWKEKILKAVGKNGQIIIDLVSDYEIIIGSQPELPVLNASLTQNRFNLVMQEFFRSISSEKHPLILFLDDLQWTDNGSLNLLNLIMSDKKKGYLLVIGAYRDNEVSDSHPLAMTINELKSKNLAINHLSLGPLEKEEVNQLVKETLKCSADYSLTLTDIIFRKTAGNPFFLGRFFETLYEKKLVFYDYKIKEWKWDVDKINAEDITENVVELMASKVRKLAPQTQQTLKQAACIGNEFDLNTLSYLQNTGLQGVMINLWEAVAQGFIIPINDNYQVVGMQENVTVYFKFIHDRIHQATHSLLSDIEINEVNLKIARQLYSNTSKDILEEKILHIANYYIAAIELISDSEEKKEVAIINLKAAKKAKNATAYKSAIKYFDVAIYLLGKNLWKENYDLAFQIFKGKGESQFLGGDFKSSDDTLRIATEKAQSEKDKSEIYIIKLAQLSGQGKYNEAIEIAIQALNVYGMNIPEFEDMDGLNEVIKKEESIFEQNMIDNQIDQLYHLPLLTNTNMITCYKIIGIALDSLILGTPEYLKFFTMKMVNLSIQYGISEYTSAAYVFFAVEQSVNKNYTIALQFSRVAVKLCEEKFDNDSITCKVYHMYAYFCMLDESYLTASRYYLKSYQKALEVGDFPYVGYSLAVYPRYCYPLNLNKGLQETQKAISFFKEMNNPPMLLLSEMEAGFAKNLMGLTNSISSFDYQDFNEVNFNTTFEEASPFLLGLYKRYKLQALVVFGFYEDALTIAKESNKWVEITGGIDLGFRSEFYLYSGITYANINKEDSSVKQQYLEDLDSCIYEIKLLTNVCTINFLHIQFLLEAERARLDQNIIKAMDLYDQAIYYAQKNQYLMIEAVANELTARFYLEIKKKQIAKIYMTQAHYLFDIWGATAKVSDLESRYGSLIESKKASGQFLKSKNTIHSTGTTTSHANENLDLLSVMKTAQLISKEIRIDALLKKLMQVLIENAGAQQGLLLLKDEKEQLSIEASFSDDGTIKVLQNVPFEMNDDLPVTIIQYVERTRKALVLASAHTEGTFTHTPYVKEKKPKSVLCIPILRQNQLKAILYLENSLIANVFNENRLLVLNTITSQIAISIDNSLLYRDLEEKVIQRTNQVVVQKDEIIQLKNKEITTTALVLAQKNELAGKFKDDLLKITDGVKNQKIKTQLRQFILRFSNNHLSSDEDWNSFKSNFESINENFFDNLEKAHPQLTTDDFKLCVYLYLNLSTKEIATLVNLEIRTVEKRRARLIKKLDLAGEDKNKLLSYIRTF